MAAARHADLIRQAQLLLRRVLDAELRPYGLTFSQFAVLQALAEHPEESLAALADRSGVTTHATPQAPRRKRAASLVGAAEPAPALDHLGEPTEAGRLLVAGATAVVERVEEHMLTGMAGRDRDRLAGLLQRCVDNLQKPLPPQQHVSAAIR